MARVADNIDNDDHIEFSIGKLLKAGYKLTRTREVIIRMLGESPGLYDADSLYMKIKKDHPDTGIATVYRTLDLLTKLRIICRVVFGSDKTYYMLSKDCYKHAFVYMICNNCGKIIANNECLNSSLKIRLRDRAEENILKNCKLQVDNYQVLFTGLCDECRKG
ncbi:MAG: transcriptional repressor [Actinobacteria bacterium]|nr:transcriptional repressor [Actinomycetota bacterium]